jgi:hypothetical protein
MLVRDRLGYIHNVPNRAYGSQEVIYDGLGNPVGFAFLAPLLSAIGPALSSALPSILGAIAPAIGNLLGGGKIGGAPETPAQANAPQAPSPQATADAQSVAQTPACPACPVCPVCGNSAEIVQPFPTMPPMPIPMPVPLNVAYMHPRPRRRFHARPR